MISTGQPGMRLRFSVFTLVQVEDARTSWGFKLLTVFAAVSLHSYKYRVFLCVEYYIFFNNVETVCPFFDMFGFIFIIQGCLFDLYIGGVLLTIILQIIGTLLDNFNRVVR